VSATPQNAYPSALCMTDRCCMDGIKPAEPCWGGVEVSDYGFDESRGSYPIYTCDGHRESKYKPNVKIRDGEDGASHSL